MSKTEHHPPCISAPSFLEEKCDVSHYIARESGKRRERTRRGRGEFTLCPATPPSNSIRIGIFVENNTRINPSTIKKIKVHICLLASRVTRIIMEKVGKKYRPYMPENLVHSMSPARTVASPSRCKERKRRNSPYVINYTIPTWLPFHPSSEASAREKEEEKGKLPLTPA